MRTGVNFFRMVPVPFYLPHYLDSRTSTPVQYIQEVLSSEMDIYFLFNLPIRGFVMECD
jgi:hypothetical protein